MDEVFNWTPLRTKTNKSIKHICSCEFLLGDNQGMDSLALERTD